MNLEKARKLIRQVIKTIHREYDLTDSIEWEVLGGLISINPKKVSEELQEAIKPENFQAWSDDYWKRWNAGWRPHLEEILHGAACGCTEQEINDDTRIDSIIREIQETYAGFIIEGEEGNFLYEP